MALKDKRQAPSPLMASVPVIVLRYSVSRVVREASGGRSSLTLRVTIPYALLLTLRVRSSLTLRVIIPESLLVAVLARAPEEASGAGFASLGFLL